MSFFASSEIADVKFPEILEKKKLLIPASRTAMGRKVLQWFDRQGLQPDVLGEFDDVALMLAFAQSHKDTIFIAPSSLLPEGTSSSAISLVGQIPSVAEEYYVIFAERMIQHPSVKSLCDADLKDFFCR
jgi:LysR family transcriptional activator of nhaA